MTDFDATQSDFAKYPECDCVVHSGFQKAIDSVYPKVLKEVTRLSELFPTYSVKVTGHSMGAAIAQLNGMYLIKDGFATTMINFGQPRVGDATYAALADSLFSQYRVVHYQDPVPAIPLQNMNYRHSAYEMYEDKDHVVRQCDSTGEDPTCSDQWRKWQLDGNDHTLYLD